MEKQWLLLVGFGALVFAAGASAATQQSTNTSTSVVQPLLLPPQGGGGGGGGGGGTPAPKTATLTLADRNVAARTFEVDSSNGVVEIINVATNQITLKNGSATSTFTIDQVMLQMAGGNATTAAADKAEFIASLSNPANTARYAAVPASSSASTSFTGITAQSATGKKGSKVLASFKGLAAPKTTYAPMLLPPEDGGDDDFGCDPDFSCDMDRIDYGDDGGGVLDFYYYADAGGSGASDPTDYSMFIVWQKTQCDNANDYQTDLAVEYVSAIGACATVETGIGAIPCAAAIAAIGITTNRGLTADKGCREIYPGQGNWG
jgi:hypothetical protein